MMPSVAEHTLACHQNKLLDVPKKYIQNYSLQFVWNAGFLIEYKYASQPVKWATKLHHTVESDGLCSYWHCYMSDYSRLYTCGIDFL